MESNVQATSRRAVVLLSGGLDSVTALAIAKSQGFSCYALSFRYGQRHSVELAAAERNAAALGAIRHQICDIDLRWVGGSALTSEVSVPKDRSLSAMNDGEIPITYVPARNTLFLSYALGWAEVLGATAIVIGANVYDSSGYPDCRPAFLRAFEQLAELGTRAGAQGQKIAIFAPLIDMTKAEIIQAGLKLGVDYSLTHSCYDPIGDLACGRCDSCLLRSKGFREAGAADPTRYVAPTKTQ